MKNSGFLFATLSFIATFLMSVVAGADAASTSGHVPAKDNSKCLKSEDITQIFDEFRFVISESARLQLKKGTFDWCDDSSIVYATVAGIQLLRSLPELGDEKSEFNQNIMGRSPYDYFKRRVRKVVIDRKDSDVCGDYSTGAYVKERNQTIYICPQATLLPKLNMAAQLVHEARHLDDHGYKHVHCDRGPLKGSLFGCDETYEARGSYGIGAEFMVRVSKSDTLNSSTRLQARSEAVSDFLSTFNQPPFSIREGIALLSQEGEVSFYDGELVEEMFRLSPSDLLTHTNLQLFAINLEQNKQTIYQYSPTLLERELGYKPDSDSNSLEILDLDQHKFTRCYLQRTELSCTNNEKQAYLEIENLRPRSFIGLESTLAFISEDGYAYSIDRSLIFTAKFKAENFKKSKAPWNLISLAPWKSGRKIGVDWNGQVREYRSLPDKSSPIELLKGKAYRKVIGPIWWSRELEEL